MKNYQKMATILFAGTAVLSLLLLGNSVLPMATAQTGGNATGGLEEMIQSRMQSSPQEFPTQQGDEVFVLICNRADTPPCEAYNLVLIPPES
jgi:hypothetical protein